MAANFIDWPGARVVYRYWFLENPSDPAGIKSESGNYMFVKPTISGWVPVYIGIADNLRDRIPCHERWAEAVRLGATRVMGHTNAVQMNRETEERDLIGRWNPLLNTHHRRATLLTG